MNPCILNREFQHPADGWYQIERKGQHPNRAAAVVQVIDDEAAQAIVNRFNADAAAGTLRHGHELLIDHEHFAERTDQESRAYGWATQLANRADGIYAQIRWTKTGKEAVDGGDYRFFSTVYDPADLKVLNHAPKHVRPLRLDGLTLTNMNNNRGQRPITNREPHSPGTSPEAQTTATQKPNMKSIAAELGLAPEAAEEAVLGEVRKLKNRADHVTAITTERDALKARNAELEAEQVDGLLAAHGVKEEKVINRLRPVLAAMKNRADREAFLTECVTKAGPANSGKPSNGKVLNRGEGNPAEAAAAEDEKQRAQKVLNRARELQATGMKFEPAWAQANREHAPAA